MLIQQKIIHIIKMLTVLKATAFIDFHAMVPFFCIITYNMAPFARTAHMKIIGATHTE